MPAAPTPRPHPRGARRRSALAALAVLVAVVGSAVACGTSGRALRDPTPGATAPPRRGASTTTATAAFDTLPGGGLSITTTAWEPGGAIPVGYTCDGQEVSPPFTIVGAPEGTVELVLVVTDPDAGGFVHWVVAGIPPDAPSFPQGGVPAGAVEVPNSGGSTAWVAPCPPPGVEHTYDVAVHALARPSGLGPTSSPEEVSAVLAEASTSVAALTGTYARA